MGLLILIVVGALLGWLASIILHIEEGRGILVNAAIGVVASLLAGLVAGNGVIFGTVSASALLWAVAGAILAIAMFNLIRQRAYR